MSILDAVKVAVFDMDGVIWAMEDPIPAAADAIDRCRHAGVSVYFLTNNSSKTRADYVAKLSRFGIVSSAEEVVTSAHATAQWLQSDGARGKAVVVIGEEGLRCELTGIGVRLVEYSEGDRVHYVVVGWDRGLTYDKLLQAHGAIVSGGARFIATNRDATYPLAHGRTIPGGGSIVAAVATSTGVEPITIGKPEPYTLVSILSREQVEPERCLVIGDRLDTDIAIAKRVGARSALVLTGVSTAEEVALLPDEQRPDYVWADLSCL